MTPKLLTSGKTAGKQRQGFQKGYDPRRGHGAKGRSGRKPWSWRESCRQALINAKADVVLAKIISGDLLEFLGTGTDGKPVIGPTKNADRVKAIQLATSYAEGLPVQPTVDLTPREPASLTAEQLAGALPRMIGLLPGHARDKAKLLEALDADYEVVE